ncbi:MAG: DNA-processing protein DprA [Opitutales bacterium]
MLSHLDAALTLNAIPHWGPIRVARVCEEASCSFEEIFELSDRELKSIRDIGTRSIDSLRRRKEVFDLDREKRNLEKSNTQFLTRADASYPQRLKNLPDAPIGLYWRGPQDASLAEIAIVGSRRTSPYGRRLAEEWARVFSEKGITVVSGLARGIDGHAHYGALDGRGNTIAVLGSALDRIYPAEHIDLFRQIEHGGAVVSEMPFGRPASKTSFPMRNRIVSGMVRLVLVVETDESGGSMITAKFAADQGKIVAAIPGRIDSKQSAGCHQLIRDGAILVTSPDEVLEELSWETQYRGTQLDFALGTESESQKTELSPIESQILATLEGGESASADRFVDILDRPFPEVASTLMMLELKQSITKRADGTYEKR